MRNLRNFLVLASAMTLAACATRILSPEKAPEYLTTGDPTPFYLTNPRPSSEPEELLKAETRVKVLRKTRSYSLVLLEDSRRGYVANAYITPTPPGSQTRPFGSLPESDRQPRGKRRAGVNPTPEPAPSPEAAPADSNAPPTDTTTSPEPHAPPADVPTPTPTPVPLEKPKFRL